MQCANHLYHKYLAGKFACKPFKFVINILNITKIIIRLYYDFLSIIQFKFGFKIQQIEIFMQCANHLYHKYLAGKFSRYTT